MVDSGSRILSLVVGGLRIKFRSSVSGAVGQSRDTHRGRQWFSLRLKSKRGARAPRRESKSNWSRQALAAYFFRKRSTRPPVSTIFCLPV